MDNLTDEQKVKFNEMLETWDTMKNAIKVIMFIGKVTKFVIGLGIVFAAGWSYITNHVPK